MLFWHWSKSGWIKFFSKNKAVEPEEMMTMKFAGSVTQPELAETFKRMGFNIVSIDTPDMLMGLQSNMVESMYASPMMAASYQWFALANNMLDMKVTPLLGGIVISERAWKKVSDKYKEDFLEAAAKMAEGFYSEAVAIEEKAMTTMINNGLIINQPKTGTKEAWRALLGEDFSVMVGDGAFVSTESYEKVSSMLEDFRSR